MGIKNLFSAKDMTQGAPWKRLLEFSIPMLIGNLAQQLYNTVDSVIVGRYVGDNALAAVGSAGPVNFLLLALFTGIATGAGIVISQSFGAKDRESLSMYIGNCITLAAIASVFVMIIGPIITMPMLRLLSTPESIIDWCADYLKIFFIGVSGFFFYNILSGILRGLGDSISALLFLLVSAGLNVVLDIVFVAYFQMGVAGVSLATVIAQIISAICCFLRLMRMNDIFDLNKSTLKLGKKYVSRILSVGIPAGVTQAILATAGMMVQSLTNNIGEMVIACNVIIMRVDGFAMMPNMSFGQAIGVFVGQNVGANKLDRVYKGMKQSMIMAVGFSTVITLCLFFFGKYLFAIFTTTPELIDMAEKMIRVMAAGYICCSVTQILGGVMRGAGDTVNPMWISIISMVGIRLPVAYILAYFTKSAEYPNGHPYSVFLSLMISWTLGAVISFVVYKIGKWKKKMYDSAGAYGKEEF